MRALRTFQQKPPRLELNIKSPTFPHESLLVLLVFILMISISILQESSWVCISASLARCKCLLQIKPTCDQPFVLPIRGAGAVPARTKTVKMLGGLRPKKPNHPKNPKPKQKQQQRPKLPPRGRSSWRSQLFLPQTREEVARMKFPKLMVLAVPAAAMLARDVSLAVGPGSDQEIPNHEVIFF